MTTMEDLPNIKKNTLRHKKSLTEDTLEQMVANNPVPIKKNHSYQNGKSEPLRKKPHNGIIKKRKSEAALYINTSTLFPLHTSTKERPKHSKLNNGHHNYAHKSKSGRYSHHNTLLQNKNKRLANKRRSYNPYDSKDKYEAFDFNAYRQKQEHSKEKQQKQEQFVSHQTRRRAITVNPPHSKPFKKLRSTSPKSVKFSPNSALNNRSTKKNRGISFRKSHNNLPIMHPDEAKHTKKKKKNFNLYKQRASYSAAHFSKHKHQLLSQQRHSRKQHPHYGAHTGMHQNSHMMKEDDAFVNSLLEPNKKKELQEAIQKLKEVIESANIKGLCGSRVEETLREVLRKLQLLRLEVTLREYRQHSNAANNTDHETTTDEEMHPSSTKSMNGVVGAPMSMIASQSFDTIANLHLDEIKEEKEKEVINVIAESPQEAKATKQKPKAIKTQTAKEKAIEEEQNRILNALDNDDNDDIDDHIDDDIQHIDDATDTNLVSALLFASKYHRNHYEIDMSKSSDLCKSGANGDKTIPRRRKITLTRRRFTLSAAKPSDSDRAGIEVAQWLSTRYSTFGRYEIPPSPLSQPIKSLSPRNINNTKKNMKQLSLNNCDSSELERKENERRKKLFDEKKRKVSATRIDINRFLKFITSDQILMKLEGVGDDWNWSTFELHDICGDSILLITAHYIFEQLNLFEKFSVSYNKFQSFFSVIQRGYEKNPYHSSLHAADVLINIYFWIKSDHEFRSYLSDLDMIIALISAACHDYLHPGLTQNFQIATNSDMALKYNGRSVLENMHCSETIRLLLRPEYAIFGSLKKSEFRYVRELITDMILGTDMQMHSNHVQKSSELCCLYEDSATIDKEKHTKHVLVVGLHVADIANPCKPWLDCKRWTYMLMEEWFRQGDKEKKMGLEVSPMMDRSKPNIPRGQVGFIDYIVKPIFVNWSKLFPHTSICLEHLQTNRDNWNKCNADPHANNVQYTLSQLATNPNGIKLLQLHEPIGLDHPNHTPIPADDDEDVEDEAVIVIEKKKKKKRSRKKKKQKKRKSAKSPSLKVNIIKSADLNINGTLAIEKAAEADVKDVPFTPEQAEALHVTPTYSDVVSSDNDQ